jgi:hypothetical protein
MNEEVHLQNQIPEILDETPSREEILADDEGEAVEPIDGLADPIDDSNGDGASRVSVSTADGEDQAPLLPSVPQDPSMARMEALERELATLKEQLAQKDAQSARMEAEIDEFTSLYPQIALRALPDSVWSDVANGIPIAAAYALAERRRSREAELAKETNQINNSRSSGSLTGTESDYFSPAEVRSMTPAEVKSNYKKIMYSMQKWH